MFTSLKYFGADRRPSSRVNAFCLARPMSKRTVVFMPSERVGMRGLRFVAEDEGRSQSASRGWWYLLKVLSVLEGSCCGL